MNEELLYRTAVHVLVHTTVVPVVVPVQYRYRYCIYSTHTLATAVDLLVVPTAVGNS